MEHYYCYLLDGAGHVTAREIMTADDDNRAVVQAQAYLERHPLIPAVEVWLAERRLKKLWQAKRSDAASGHPTNIP